MENKNKSRYWLLEMYEDSRPNNWYEILEKTMLKICISPRHDKDVKEDGSGLKKAHYHVLLCFEGPTTYNNALKIAEKLGANIVFQAYSVKGSYEYFTHKNNPEKAQYDIKDMIYINGFNIEDVYDLTTKETEDIKREIINIIREKRIIEYSEIYDLLLDNEMYDHTKVLSCNTIFFVAYIRSKRYILTDNNN